jgi:hypothetical protein
VNIDNTKKLPLPAVHGIGGTVGALSLVGKATVGLSGGSPKLLIVAHHLAGSGSAGSANDPNTLLKAAAGLFASVGHVQGPLLQVVVHLLRKPQADLRVFEEELASGFLERVGLAGRAVAHAIGARCLHCHFLHFSANDSDEKKQTNNFLIKKKKEKAKKNKKKKRRKKRKRLFKQLSSAPP